MSGSATASADEMRHGDAVLRQRAGTGPAALANVHCDAAVRPLDSVDDPRTTVDEEAGKLGADVRRLPGEGVAGQLVTLRVFANEHRIRVDICIRRRRAAVAPDRLEIERRLLCTRDLVHVGSKVETDWTPGSPIVWRGEYEGKKYEDKGEILEVEPGRRLKMSHFSPLGGQDDVPENYHTLVYELESAGERRTPISLSQDNNPTEEAAEHSRANWETMLSGLKQVVESG